jgi:lysophospholipase L1-like esterase
MQYTLRTKVLLFIIALVLWTLTSTVAFSQTLRASGSPAAAGPAPKTDFKFSFGPGKIPDGFTQVLPETTYTAGGFGFDLNSKPTGVDRGGGDALHSHFITGDPSFAFSVDVPEGNYRVTVTVGDPQGESTTTFLAESRRLMIEKVHTDSGASATVSFTVNVRNSKIPPPPANAPGGSEVRLNRLDNALTWDNKLTLQFTNTRPCVNAVEIHPVVVPTVFLAGDSTVTDQPRDPGASWGQMFPAFFKDDIAIANHATSGETLKSFITGLRLDKILSQMKSGDYLLMQFGHNDEKQSWPQTYVEPATTYKAYLKVFIAEARRRGATPVIISPMERRNGITGNSHGGFPQAAMEAAKEENVAFIDNWANSKTMYAAMGDDVAAAFNDTTHHRNYGAYEIAKLVATGIRQNHLDLAKSLRDDFKDLDPAHPDPLSAFNIPMK